MSAPTPRTDTATYPADCLGKTLVTNRDCARELERELTTLTAELTIALTKWNGALERALKAEADLVALAQCHDDNCRAVVKIAAELATERARFDWLESPSGMDWQWEPTRLTVSRASIDAAMKEDAK